MAQLFSQPTNKKTTRTQEKQLQQQYDRSLAGSSSSTRINCTIVCYRAHCLLPGVCLYSAHTDNVPLEPGKGSIYSTTYIILSYCMILLILLLILLYDDSVIHCTWLYDMLVAFASTFRTFSCSMMSNKSGSVSANGLFSATAH